MSQQESESRLNEVISGIQDTVASVVSLVDQVLNKLKAAGDAVSDIDLTDETATLAELQSSLQGAASDMQDALGADTNTDTGDSGPTEAPTGDEPQVNPL